MQHFLKASAGAADARIVSAELFEELFVAVHDAVAALDVGFGGVAPAALPRRRKSWAVRRSRGRVA
jgi:hypothetical protein